MARANVRKSAHPTGSGPPRAGRRPARRNHRQFRATSAQRTGTFNETLPKPTTNQVLHLQAVRVEARVRVVRAGVAGPLHLSCPTACNRKSQRPPGIANTHGAFHRMPCARKSEAWDSPIATTCPAAIAKSTEGATPCNSQGYQMHTLPKSQRPALRKEPTANQPLAPPPTHNHRVKY